MHTSASTAETHTQTHTHTHTRINSEATRQRTHAPTLTSMGFLRRMRLAARVAARALSRDTVTTACGRHTVPGTGTSGSFNTIALHQSFKRLFHLNAVKVGIDPEFIFGVGACNHCTAVHRAVRMQCVDVWVALTHVWAVRGLASGLYPVFVPHLLRSAAVSVVCSAMQCSAMRTRQHAFFMATVHCRKPHMAQYVRR